MQSQQSKEEDVHLIKTVILNDFMNYLIELRGKIKDFLKYI